MMVPPNRSARWVALGVVVAGALGAIGACQTPTSMTVVVTTDVACDTLSHERRAHFVVGNPEAVQGSLEAASTKACEGQGEIGDIVLLPSGDEGAEVAFKVILGVDVATETCGTGEGTEEQKWAGCIIARRRLRFIEGEALAIDVPLHDECIGVPCSEESFETCVAGGKCVPSDIDPTECLDGGCGEDDLGGTSSASSSAVGTGTGTGSGGAPPTSSTGVGGEGGAGGGGGDGGRGGGRPVCEDPTADCDAPEECRRFACEEGACVEHLRDAGAPCDGGACDAEGRCVTCLSSADCLAAECEIGSCEGGTCTFEDEPDGTECSGGTCTAGACQAPPHCSNGGLDAPQGETGVDCGGPCQDCDVGGGCAIDEDCKTDFCLAGLCALCSGEADCPVGEHCDDEGACVDDVPNGGDCDPNGDGTECASGQCEESGTCCNVACDGPCVSCATGTCEPRDVASVEEPGCAPDACTVGCDGQGECAFEPDTTVCDRDCAAGVATTAFCDGAGFCGPPTNDDPCYPFLCEGAVCGSSCADASECVTGATCEQNECTLECNSPGECEDPPSICLVAMCQMGHCLAVPGNEGAPCRAQRCSDDGRSVELPGECSIGSCIYESTPCPGSYACRSGACLTSCVDDQDCTGGASCDFGVCGFGGTTSSSATTTTVGASSSSSGATTSTSASGPTVASSSVIGVAAGDLQWSDGGAPPW